MFWLLLLFVIEINHWLLAVFDPSLLILFVDLCGRDLHRRVNLLDVVLKLTTRLSL